MKFLIDSDFRVVADVVSDLKMMAIDMGDELEKQNAKLDRINVKVVTFTINCLMYTRNSQSNGQIASLKR